MFRTIFFNSNFNACSLNELHFYTNLEQIRGCDDCVEKSFEDYCLLDGCIQAISLNLQHERKNLFFSFIDKSHEFV